ncbi:Protein CBG06967 [Caenorhabditis briggsae]|uniref:Protein CBG06967 n=1 Tax=Caenorhabditis briggsae TaxID=6238 RepID=A8X412_CAEBR|nr:Protein CBG06967 [Caenorhabditis briggsae]CAP27372.2 Protein CBG06967 [Caenorhabditis briggsae]
MGNTEEELVEEWVQDSQNGSQVPLDHLVSFINSLILSAWLRRFLSMDTHYWALKTLTKLLDFVKSNRAMKKLIRKLKKESTKSQKGELGHRKRAVCTEMDRTMDRRDRDDNHSNYYIAEG